MRIVTVGVALVAACSIPPFSGPLDGASTHDEDMDGVPDVDDPCPHIANANHDTDGDGVGDACDPNPTPGETKRFYSFDSGVEDLYIDGVVAPASDAIDLGSLGDINNFVWVPNTFTDVRVEIGFEVLAIGTASYQELVVRTAHTPSTIPGDRFSESCDVARTSETSSRLEAGDSMTPAQMTSDLPLGFAQLSGHMLVAQFSGYRCSIDQLPGSNAASTTLPLPLTYSQGRVGISAHDAIVRLRYIFVAGR